MHIPRDKSSSLFRPWNTLGNKLVTSQSGEENGKNLRKRKIQWIIILFTARDRMKRCDISSIPVQIILYLLLHCRRFNSQVETIE
jgi:hypothetical protein